MPLSLVAIVLFLSWSGASMVQAESFQAGTTFSQQSGLSTQSVKIIIPGDPVAMARPRFGNGTTYNRKDMTDTKTSMSWQIAMQWSQPKIPRDRAVSVAIVFYFKALRKKDIGKFRPRKPDCDNLAKMVMDASNGIVYEDDAQVVDLRCSKWWAAKAETVITITDLGL